jgi:hypothetical protein
VMTLVEVDSKIRVIEAALELHPDDRGLKMSLAAMKKLAAKIAKETNS